MSVALVAVATMLAMFLLATLFLWIVDGIRDRKPSAEEIERDNAQYLRKLDNPNWSFVAAKFGGEVPFAVQQLYSDKKLLYAEDISLDEDHEIVAFVPANDDAFDPEQWFSPASDAFVIAVTRFGDPFFVRVSEAPAGLPVYLYYHDGGDTEPIAPSLQTFLEVVRRAPREGRT